LNFGLFFVIDKSFLMKAYSCPYWENIYLTNKAINKKIFFASDKLFKYYGKALKAECILKASKHFFFSLETFFYSCWKCCLNLTVMRFKLHNLWQMMEPIDTVKVLKKAYPKKEWKWLNICVVNEPCQLSNNDLKNRKPRENLLCLTVKTILHIFLLFKLNVTHCWQIGQNKLVMENSSAILNSRNPGDDLPNEEKNQNWTVYWKKQRALYTKGR